MRGEAGLSYLLLEERVTLRAITAPTVKAPTKTTRPESLKSTSGLPALFWKLLPVVGHETCSSELPETQTVVVAVTV